ncbi:MAG TPA: DegT/DnrJ/EryC1/StrS aminotransferase family protein [Solirubrobacteraceae bacterium]|nr:DegT/DnrJ/EryC1/StrS aminotransferase family protein [Solirubrobacteraceae bacterium]
MKRKLSLLGGTTTAGDCRAAVGYLLRPRRLVTGPAIDAYEQAFARAVGVRHACSFASGRVGLYAILRALGIGPGADVLLQVPTHIVVPNAIRHAGARPAYVDCVSHNWNIDLEHAARQVTPHTRALVLQHTFGIPADMDAVLNFADEHGLVLIEDCVHALGATWRGRPVGSFGRAAFFSTEETKMISTTMGGMVVTDDEALNERIRTYQRTCSWPSPGLTRRYLVKLLAYHVLTEPHVHRVARAGYEALGEAQPLPQPTSAQELRGGWLPELEQRLSNAQSAIGLRQLRRLDANLDHRRAIADRYARLITDRGFAIATFPQEATPSWVRFPLTVPDRSAAVRATHPHVVLGTWFTSVLEEARTPGDGAYADGSCPKAEDAARHLVNLPTHGRVTEDDAVTLVAALPSVPQC